MSFENKKQIHPHGKCLLGVPGTTDQCFPHEIWRFVRRIRNYRNISQLQHLAPFALEIAATLLIHPLEGGAE